MGYYETPVIQITAGPPDLVWEAYYPFASPCHPAESFFLFNLDVGACVGVVLRGGCNFYTAHCYGFRPTPETTDMTR
jgi:hypothetical protein